MSLNDEKDAKIYQNEEGMDYDQDEQVLGEINMLDYFRALSAYQLYQQTKEEEIVQINNKLLKLNENIYCLEWLEELPEVYMKAKLKSFIKDVLICQICLKLMDSVVELRCQHLLCKACFKNYTKDSHYNKCPFCKKGFLREDDRITQRVQTINFIIKQLPVPCYICVQKKKDNEHVEESKNQELNLVWEGKISDLAGHTLSHDSNLYDQKQQQCQNQGFGCSQEFNDAFSKTMHEGTTCKFRWRRCQQCMKIYFITDFYLHKCQDEDFQQQFQIQADFSTKKRENEYFYISVVFQQFFQLEKIAFLQAIRLHFDYPTKQVSDSWQSEIMVFSQFVADNILETINSKTFNVYLRVCERRIGEEWFPLSPKSSPGSTFNNEISMNQLSTQLCGTIISLLRKKISFQAEKKMRQRLWQQREEQQQQQKQQQDDWQQREQQQGQQQLVKIKGFGKTGKPFGRIGFRNEYSAETILNDSKRKGGFIKINDFSCSVAENNR